jgi:hypothetical protein
MENFFAAALIVVIPGVLAVARFLPKELLHVKRDSELVSKNLPFSRRQMSV